MKNETVNTCQKDIRSGSKRDTILFEELANVLLSNEKQKRQQATLALFSRNKSGQKETNYRSFLTIRMNRTTM